MKKISEQVPPQAGVTPTVPAIPQTASKIPKLPKRQRSREAFLGTVWTEVWGLWTEVWGL